MPLLFYVAYFVIAFALSWLVHRYFLKRSHRYTLKKANISAIRWGVQTKPIFGGAAFYMIFLLSIVFYFLIPGSKINLEEQFIGIILVPTMGFFMGLADDMLNTPPNFKFLVQLIIAFILIYFGIYIQIFQNIYLNYFITAFWVIGIMNSINMLDNMDAISSVTSFIIISAILINILLNCELNLIFFTVVLIGTLAAILAFLIYNWHPSKMYMGDNGSQFLGALLAIFSILFFWNIPVIQGETSELKSFLIVALAFVVPLTDTTSVTINRLMRGQSPFVGGKDHTTHHLSYLGIKDDKVVLILGSVSLVSAFLAVLLSNGQIILTKLTIPLLILYLSIVFGVLYTFTKISKPG